MGKKTSCGRRKMRKGVKCGGRNGGRSRERQEKDKRDGEKEESPKTWRNKFHLNCISSAEKWSLFKK